MRSDRYVLKLFFHLCRFSAQIILQSVGDDGPSRLLPALPSLGVTGDYHQIFRREICRQPADIQQDIPAETTVQLFILETCLQVAPPLYIRVAGGELRLSVSRVLERSLHQIC